MAYNEHFEAQQLVTVSSQLNDDYAAFRGKVCKIVGGGERPGWYIIEAKDARGYLHTIEVEDRWLTKVAR